MAATGISQTWLEALLARNTGARYLAQFGSPCTLQAFRDRVPVVGYDELEPWLQRIASGEANVLFRGRPCAFERTGGSTGGGKLLPYTPEGLQDFQDALAPWLTDTVARWQLRGSVYLATSPATRVPETVGGLPVGLPDGAYLGPAWGRWVAEHTAVPLDVAQVTDIEAWRERTLQALAAAHDLEMISVWSPTFLLRLLDDLPEPSTFWPRLKLVSCWCDAASRGPAEELRARLPHAYLQPKGLMATEGVVTVPDGQDRPVLTPHGFFEFLQGGELLLATQLQREACYEVVATTANGLYRYRSGDLVRCLGHTATGRPVLRFEGRCGIVCDLVGEKLVEAFVQQALQGLGDWAFLTPRADRAGYLLVTATPSPVDLAAIEARLERNPQYAYARRLDQLAPLVQRHVPALHERHMRHRLAQGTRLADIKPLALIPDALSWLA